MKYLTTALLLSAMSLPGCSDAAADLESALQGRWHRVGEPGVDDPFQTIASEYIEFRPNGVLVSLLFDQGPQLFWTVQTGKYSVAETDQLMVKGKCWQGWQSYDCSRTYRFELDGNSLKVFENGAMHRRVEYERVGAASSDFPPTLAPPMPSPTPAAQLNNCRC